MRRALSKGCRLLPINCWRTLFALCIGLMSVHSGVYAAITDSVAGRRAFASYIVYFARYIDWPQEAFQSPRSPFMVCVLGEDPLGPVLDSKLRFKEVRDRAFRITRLGSGNLEAAQTCHILIVGASEAAIIKEILSSLDNLSVLTISDVDGFAASGGMIGFVGSGRAMSMQLNRTMLSRARFKVAEKLLRLGGR